MFTKLMPLLQRGKALGNQTMCPNLHAHIRFVLRLGYQQATEIVAAFLEHDALG
jgi:hypothetical protein